MTMGERSPRVVLAITGATGAVFGVRILERLMSAQVEVHLIVTTWGQRNIEHEMGLRLSDVQAMAHSVYSNSNLAATLSSGSFPVDAMIVAPCSVKTLAGIANGYSDGLVTRAADVQLKEGRKLLLLVRETPLNQIHLENMLRVARAGATIMPPVPAFYNKAESLDDLIDHIAVRTLDQLGLPSVDFDRRWDGVLRHGAPTKETNS